MAKLTKEKLEQLRNEIVSKYGQDSLAARANIKSGYTKSLASSFVGTSDPESASVGNKTLPVSNIASLEENPLENRQKEELLEEQRKTNDSLSKLIESQEKNTKALEELTKKQVQQAKDLAKPGAARPKRGFGENAATFGLGMVAEMAGLTPFFERKLAERDEREQYVKAETKLRSQRDPEFAERVKQDPRAVKKELRKEYKEAETVKKEMLRLETEKQSLINQGYSDKDAESAIGYSEKKSELDTKLAKTSPTLYGSGSITQTHDGLLEERRDEEQAKHERLVDEEEKQTEVSEKVRDLISNIDKNVKSVDDNIKKMLEKMGDLGGGGGSLTDMLPDFDLGGDGSGKKKPSTGKGRLGKILGGAKSLGGKLLGGAKTAGKLLATPKGMGALAIAGGAYAGYRGYTEAGEKKEAALADIQSKVDSGEITPQEAKEQIASIEKTATQEKSGAIGEGGGTALGGLAGAAKGAAIGTAILPGVGTVVGGLIGGGLGAWAGGKAGKAVGTAAPGAIDLVKQGDARAKGLSSGSPKDVVGMGSPTISNQDSTERLREIEAEQTKIARTFELGNPKQNPDGSATPAFKRFTALEDEKSKLLSGTYPVNDSSATSTDTPRWVEHQNQLMQDTASSASSNNKPTSTDTPRWVEHQNQLMQDTASSSSSGVTVNNTTNSTQNLREIDKSQDRLARTFELGNPKQNPDGTASPSFKKFMKLEDERNSLLTAKPLVKDASTSTPRWVEHQNQLMQDTASSPSSNVTIDKSVTNDSKLNLINKANSIEAAPKQQSTSQPVVVQVPSPPQAPPPQDTKYVDTPFNHKIKNSEPSISTYLKARYT